MSILQHKTDQGLIISNIQERTYTSPERAFKRAIREGRLSDSPDAQNFAGFYMYMGDKDGISLFKHITRREYLPMGV